ncbi:MAG: hypothetical protein ABW223_02190, partial [Rariglobus sp.]
MRLHAVGLVLFISGFLGVLSFLLLGISRNLPLALGVHATVTALCVAGCMWKYGGATAWARESRKGMTLS